ncbi:MAG: hypothetical protein ABGZ37_08555 [Akkermansiaceae bacterium]
MIWYHVNLILMVITACILQQFSPAFEGLYEARVLMVPLVFLCAAVTVNVGPMLLLAFVCGFLWDAQHILGQHEVNTQVYVDSQADVRFGYSIVLYAMMGFIMQGIQPLFREGKWHVSALLSGVAIFLYLFVEYMFITFIRGDLILTHSLFLKITFTALMTMFLCPLVFWSLFRLAALFHHTIRYEGLKTDRRAFVD